MIEVSNSRALLAITTTFHLAWDILVSQCGESSHADTTGIDEDENERG